MKRNLLWRGLLILASVLAAVGAAYPPQQKINLGLDLRGGMHLVLQVHTEDALRAETDADMARLVQQVKDDTQGKLEIKPQRTGDTRIVVPGLTPEAKTPVIEAAKRVLSRFNHGERGDSVIFEMLPADVSKLRDQSVNQAVQTIRNRIDAYGVTEPVIQAAGGDRIVVQLPGVDDFDRVRKLIKNTAFLEFRITVYPKDGGHAVTREDIVQHFGGRVPDDVEIVPAQRGDRDAGSTAPLFYAVEKRRTVTGRDLRGARPQLGQMNQPIVEFNLTPDGSRAFATLTGEHVGSGLAIVLDGQIVSAPVIRSRISDSGIIEGSFTQKEVEDLATVLRSGALPASITYLEERTVGPSLGRDSIREGLRAGVVGSALVVLVMLLYYRLSGVNAISALVQRAAAVRRHGTVPFHAHPARHRRRHPDHRHGGGRQRAGLRAYPRGAARRAHGALGDRQRLRAGLHLHHRHSCDDADLGDVPVPVRHRTDQGLRRHPVDRPAGLAVHLGVRQPLDLRPGAVAPQGGDAVDLTRPERRLETRHGRAEEA